MTNQPFNYTGPPPPPGYGFQITSQGGQISGKNLICHSCGALVPDEVFFKDAHDQFHRSQDRLLKTLNNALDAVEKLKAQYLIQEEPG